MWWLMALFLLQVHHTLLNFLLKKLNVSGLVASSENYELLLLAELSFGFILSDLMRLSLFFF